MSLHKAELRDRTAVSSINKATVTNFFAALTDDNPAAARSLLDQSAEFWVLSHRKVVPGGVWLAGYQQMIRAKTSSGVRFEVSTMTAEEDRVAAVVGCEAELDDGRRYDNRYHFLFALADGRITHAWEYGDTLHSEKTFRG